MNKNRVDQLQTQWAYDRWADARTYASIRALGMGRARSVQLFSHLVEAKRLWFLRITGEYKHVKGVWNDWSLEECESQLQTVERQWIDFMTSQTDDALENTITYTNTQGQSFSNTINEIITHVLYHSTYHRGQIAMEVRKAGGTPAQTDYITFCRE
ncbi:DinB family protein [bacterium]|nr:DinB family protein [bacterium]NUN46990.1 DinB family protein [bacterium]